MKRAIFAIVIGILGCMAHIVVGVRCIIHLVHLKQWDINGIVGHTIATYLTLVFCVLMAIVSLLLVLGAAKNRPKLIGIWVILSAIGMVGSALELIYYFSYLTVLEIVIYLVFLVICGIIWYLIFTLWIDMRRGKPVGLKSNRPPEASVVPSGSGQELQPMAYTSVPQREA